MGIKLNDIDKKQPFEVPDGYFENLTSNIQNRIEEKPVGILNWSKTMKWALVPTMAVLIVFSIWIFGDMGYSDYQGLALLDEVSDTDILAYLDNEDLSIDEVASLAEAPDKLILEATDHLEGIDFEEENLDELINTIDLNELYL